MKKGYSFRKLHMESLEERSMLAVLSGCESAILGGSETAVMSDVPNSTEGVRTWEVNSTADKPTIWTEKNDIELTLREALRYSSPGDIITFKWTLAGKTIDIKTGSLPVDHSVTIDASSINGQITLRGFTNSMYTGSILSIAAGATVSVNCINLSCKGGLTMNGIYNKGVLSVTNCDITDCAYGIDNDGVLTVQNSYIANNRYSGIRNKNGLTVRESTIKGNSGPGIETSWSAFIKDTVISKNGQSGILLRSGTATVRYCDINGNKASNCGGGIETYSGSSMTISDCTICRNSAYYGGGICSGGSVDLVDSTIQGNSANKGAGIYREAGSSAGTMRVWNCVVTGNTGVGVYLYGYGTSSTQITNCTIASNSSYGIYIIGNDKSQLDLVNSAVVYNYANTIRTYSKPFTGTIDLGGDICYSGSVNANAHNVISSYTKWSDWSASSDCLKFNSSKPMFADPAKGDYSLKKNSQAINKGHNSYIAFYETDRSHKNRLVGGIVDVGAYEYQQLSSSQIPNLKTENGGSISQTNGQITLTTGKITNIGDEHADSGYTVKVYASNDTSINAKDILLISYTNTPSIAIGKSETLTIPNIPTKTLTPGKKYYIGWIISDVNGESVTSNNTAYCNDKLEVIAEAVLSPSVGGSISEANGKFKLKTGTITNTGNITASSYTVDVYASTDKTITTGDIKLTTYTPNSALVAGKSTQLTIKGISTSDLKPGKSYYIGWVISSVNNKAVLSENSAYCKKQLTIPHAPDLSAKNGGSITASNGQFTLKTGKISNVGNRKAASGFTIKVYASTDTTISSKDILLKTFTVKSGIKAGDSTTVTIEGISTKKKLTAGKTYYIGWIISGVDGESAKDNNTARCKSQFTVNKNGKLVAKALLPVDTDRMWLTDEIFAEYCSGDFVDFDQF